MATVLSNETLKDEIAVSLAQVLASTNRKAKELGVDIEGSLSPFRSIWRKAVGSGASITAREITSIGAAAI